ncbi:glycine zipper 2TM domain-containing protein [Aliamphritea ceti]|uniref:glycine zipper 2TM domain-containing protein n=1 Tax=Aliamphritea ceti TaxID=1524258 RepID=UPI0021C315F6|nr:glycine zipper 2TM domain-containing protein [Aliamphritea ceti]
MNKILVATVLAASVMLQGCASSLTGETYSRSEARKVQQVQYGQVLSVTPVVIEGRTNSPLGAGAGAIIGGIGGSKIGGGTGRSIATVLGAVAGGVVGQQAEEKLTRKQAQEITVELESRRIISVVQEVSGNGIFQAGDRVRILGQGGTARVTR